MSQLKNKLNKFYHMMHFTFLNMKTLTDKQPHLDLFLSILYIIEVIIDVYAKIVIKPKNNSNPIDHLY